MTTPNQRSSYKSLSSIGPCRSFLRDLLDGIRSDASQESATTPENVDTSFGVSDNGTDATTRQRPSLKRLTIPSSRSIARSVAIGEDAAPLKSPLMFCNFDLSSTPSPNEPPTSGLTAPSSNTTPPTSASTVISTDTMTTPRPLSEQMRTMTMPETPSQIVISEDEAQDVPVNQGFSGDNRRVIRNVAFIERAPFPLHRTDSHEQQLPELSSFRPDIASPEGPAPTLAARPATPMRTLGRRFASATPEPPETPSFLRPLHLFDTSNDWAHDISIYRNTQGEEWQRNSLCRHCFQLRGAFNRMMTYGYEACGRDECLDSYYWEPMA